MVCGVGGWAGGNAGGHGAEVPGFKPQPRLWQQMHNECSIFCLKIQEITTGRKWCMYTYLLFLLVHEIDLVFANLDKKQTANALYFRASWPHG